LKSSEPVDAVHNLVMASEAEMAALTALVRPGGVVLTTATPALADPERDVRGVGMQLRADAAQLTILAKKVDAGEIRVDISASYHLAQAAQVHELSAASRIRGKVILTPSA
jgi:NADPH:quinone reductase-like Zn-dependent oxidoreductase